MFLRGDQSSERMPIPLQTSWPEQARVILSFLLILLIQYIFMACAYFWKEHGLSLSETCLASSSLVPFIGYLILGCNDRMFGFRSPVIRMALLTVGALFGTFMGYVGYFLVLMIFRFPIRYSA